MRRLWGSSDDQLQRLAGEALLSLAASRVRPSAAAEGDATKLIASLLAGGNEEAAARWAPVLGEISNDGAAEQAWAAIKTMLQPPAGADASGGSGGVLGH